MNELPIFAWVVLIPMSIVVAIIVYAMSIKWGVQHGNPNDVFDPFPEKARKRYRVMYLKEVRLRQLWETSVIGYYRWWWSAKFHAMIMDYCVLPPGAIWFEKYKQPQGDQDATAGTL